MARRPRRPREAIRHYYQLVTEAPMAIRLAAVDVAPDPYALIRYAATTQLYSVTVDFRSAQVLFSQRAWVDLTSRLPARI